MDNMGNYLVHPTDTLIEFDAVDTDLPTEITTSPSLGAEESEYQSILPGVDPTVSSTRVTGTEQQTYCTFAAYSVGVGASVSAGPMSIGGGIDIGFGIEK
jgi:hypothetical protein